MRRASLLSTNVGDILGRDGDGSCRGGRTGGVRVLAVAARELRGRGAFHDGACECAQTLQHPTWILVSLCIYEEDVINSGGGS